MPTMTQMRLGNDKMFNVANPPSVPYWAYWSKMYAFFIAHFSNKISTSNTELISVFYLILSSLID
jgi:hypothetical protein